MQNPLTFTTFNPDLNEVVAQTGDHPMINVLQTLHSFKAGADNFLFSLVDRRQAVSVFVVKDRLARGGRLFVPLAHVRWDLLFSGPSNGGTGKFCRPRICRHSPVLRFGRDLSVPLYFHEVQPDQSGWILSLRGGPYGFNVTTSPRLSNRLFIHSATARTQPASSFMSGQGTPPTAP